jgi:beta-1,2-mannosidase
MRKRLQFFLKAHAQDFCSALLLAAPLACIAPLAHADPSGLDGRGLSGFKLCSPRDGDHFHVSRPLLFWQSSVGASQYEIFVDDRLLAEVDAGPVPVMSYAVQSPLIVGTHHWYVKAEGSGNEIESSHFVFTLESSNHWQWPSWAIGPFIKYGGNPILRPDETGPVWEGWNVYNPGVIFDDGRFRMLYRGQENTKVGSDNRTLSRIGYAESLDGVTFLRNAVPVIDATEPFESRYGCEDARLVKYRGVYYAFYTGNLDAGSSEICLCEATSTDCIHWKKLGIIERGTKNGAIVRDPIGTPIKIKGRFVMYIGDSKLGVCYSRDLIHWGPITWIDPKFPDGWTAPYEPCVAVANYSRKQPDNIVLFIAGTLNGKGKWFYAISEMLFSKTAVTQKFAQLDDCIMKPSESYESGTFQNCIWMNSIILHDGQWWIHYGAGDRNVGLATGAPSGT